MAPTVAARSTLSLISALIRSASFTVFDLPGCLYIYTYEEAKKPGENEFFDTAALKLQSAADAVQDRYYYGTENEA